MKNKILVITITMILALAGNAHALSQNSNNGTGTGNQLQNRQQQESQNEIGTSTQNRSQVANTVQERLRVNDGNGEAEQQVKTITQTRTQNQEKLETSLEKIQNRGGLAKFFVGPNYGEINNAKKILEQDKEQIKQLNQIKNQLANQGDQQVLTEQIEVLEQTNLEIENLLGSAQRGFSLFGWMFRLFSN